MAKDKTPKDAPEEEVVDEPEKEVEETPEEPAKEEPEEEETVEEVKPVEPPKEDVLTKEESKEEGLIPPWEKRGESKPASWKEQAEYSADLTEYRREQREKEIAKVQEENEKEAKEVNKRWNDYWDTEIKELEKGNQIPEVKDPNDPNDPGKKLRLNIFKKMQEVGLQRQKDNLPPITSVELIYHKYKDEILNEVSGADAPVSFGKKSVSGSENKDDYSYWDIHNKTPDQIKRGE